MENSALETLDCHGIEHIEIFGGLCTLLGVINEDIFWTMLEMAMKNIQLQRLCDSNFFFLFFVGYSISLSVCCTRSKQRM